MKAVVMQPAELQSNLAQFFSTERYYRHFTGMRFSDGVLFFAKHAEAFWFLDIVGSVRHLVKEEPFVVVELVVKGSTADFKMHDGNGSYLMYKRIDFTDCPEGTWKFYLQNNVLIVPSEY